MVEIETHFDSKKGDAATTGRKPTIFDKIPGGAIERFGYISFTSQDIGHLGISRDTAAEARYTEALARLQGDRNT